MEQDNEETSDLTIAKEKENLVYGQMKSKGIKGFFKKIVRKSVGFLIVPLVKQQSEYNRATLSAITKIHDASTNMAADIARSLEVDEKTKDVQEKLIDQLETKIVMLEKRVSELEKTNKDHD